MRCFSWRSSGDSSRTSSSGCPISTIWRSFEVSVSRFEQPHLLEGLALEILRLVDDQQDALLIPLLLDQETVQRIVQGALRVALVGEAPNLRIDRLQQLETGELRIEDEGHLALGAEALEQRAAERRLSGTDFTGNRDEALALLDAIQQVGQRFAMRLRQEQKTGIRAQRERFFAQAIERGIHPRAAPIEGATR